MIGFLLAIINTIMIIPFSLAQHLRFLIIALPWIVLFLMSEVNAEEEVNSWRFGWERGPTYEFNRLIPRSGTKIDSLDRFTPEFKLSGRVGGALHLDGGFIESLDAIGGGDFKTKVSQARLYTTGKYEGIRTLHYKVKFAIENSSFFVKDFYIRHYLKEDNHSLTFGYFDPPQSMMGDYALMEDPAPVSALSSGLRLGFEYGVHTDVPRLAGAVNVSTIGQNNQNEGQSGRSSPLRTTARLVYIPVYDQGTKGESALHFAGSYSYFLAGSEGLQLRTRPESFLLPYLLDTNKVPFDDGQTLAAEFLYKTGSQIHQAEILTTLANYTDSPQGTYYGAYYQVSHVFYGDFRKYDPNTGKLLGIESSENELKVVPGAFEVAGRVSYVDLTSKKIDGGKQQLASLGLNWYYNTHLAFKLEVIQGEVKHSTLRDSFTIVQGRVQLQF